MPRQYCAFHADEDVAGKRLDDGSYDFVCERGLGHPQDGEWRWLAVPEESGSAVVGLAGLAEELNLRKCCLLSSPGSGMAGLNMA